MSKIVGERVTTAPVFLEENWRLGVLVREAEG